MHFSFFSFSKESKSVTIHYIVCVCLCVGIKSNFIVLSKAAVDYQERINKRSMLNGVLYIYMRDRALQLSLKYWGSWFLLFCFLYYKTSICSLADLLLQHKKSRPWLCDTANLWLQCYHFVLGEAKKMLVEKATWYCLDYLHKRSWNEFKNICALPESADLALRSLYELLVHGFFWLVPVLGLGRVQWTQISKQKYLTFIF